MSTHDELMVDLENLGTSINKLKRERDELLSAAKLAVDDADGAAAESDWNEVSPDIENLRAAVERCER